MKTNLDYYRFIAEILNFEEPSQKLKKAFNSHNINWDKIVWIASNNLIIPTLYSRIKQKKLDQYLPDDLIQYFEFVNQENNKRNIFLIDEVTTISKILKNNNIDHVFLKGTALFLSSKSEAIKNRMIGDIDILVEVNKIEIAQTLLIDLGYTQLSSGIYDKLKHRHLPRLISNKKMFAVELHKSLLNKKNNLLQANSMLKNKVYGLNKIFIPDINHLVSHAILNYQINDKGYLLKHIDFRSFYDISVLKRNVETKNKYFNNFYDYDDILKNKNSKNNKFNKFLIISISKNNALNKYYKRIIWFILKCKALLNRSLLLLINKEYRENTTKKYL